MNIQDETLIQYARQGNEQAFNQLVERYQERIFNVCFRIVGNYHDAEEATMDAFLACYRSLGIFEGRSSFSTWLYRIAMRCAYRLRGGRCSPIQSHLMWRKRVTKWYIAGTDASRTNGFRIGALCSLAENTKRSRGKWASTI